MGFLNPDQYLQRFEAESRVESPAEISFINHLDQETKAYRTTPDLQSFADAGIYPQAEITADSTKLRNRIREIQTSGQWKFSGERSQAISNLLFYLIGRKELLKPRDPHWDTLISSSTRYDDIMRGTDLIITMCNYDTNEEVSIAIDTTTSREAVPKKKAKIDRDIREGHLRRLKYYTSPASEQPVGPQEMPAVVIGYEPDQFEIIADEWSRRKDGAIKRLQLESSIREQIIRQLTSQIATAETQAPKATREHIIAQLRRVIDLLSIEDQKNEAEN